MNENEDKIHNVDLVVEELKHWPHTYETILGNNASSTNNFIIRRKLNNLCKLGIIFKSSIPGTRFGKSIFYCLPKKYYIIVESERLGSSVYYFTKFKKLDRIRLKAEVCFYLDGINWVRKQNKIFNEGKILLFV
jgi:hypothetical protein